MESDFHFVQEKMEKIIERVLVSSDVEFHQASLNPLGNRLKTDSEEVWRERLMEIVSRRLYLLSKES